MKDLKEITIKKREYELVKEYENYYLYKDKSNKCLECFTKNELKLYLNNKPDLYR